MAIVGAFIMPHPPVILPEVGRGRERKLAQTARACGEVARRIAALAPETILLLSPHATLYDDYFHISPGAGARGNFARFDTPQVMVDTLYDMELAETIEKAARRWQIEAGTLGEENPELDHGTMIPLWFVNQKYTDYRIVRIGLSGMSPLEHYRFGKALAAAVWTAGRRTVVLASGDLSHRLLDDGPHGFTPEGPAFDRAVTRAMASGDFLSFLLLSEGFCHHAGECGLRAFQVMAGALDEQAVNAELLSYEGPFGVGYAVASFIPTGEDENRRFDLLCEQRERDRTARARASEDDFVRLARRAVESYVAIGFRIEPPDDLPPEMLEERAGVFVSLHRHGLLRGCIGTIQPKETSIAVEIIRNAIAAGSSDPRFSPIRVDELEELTYKVDILAAPEPIDSISRLNPRRFGVIVQGSNGRTGLLLPNLDGVDTPEKQIAIAKRKAGIPPEEPCRLQRFEVSRHT